MSEVPLLSRLVPALATERLHTDAAMIDESRRSLAATMISEILHVAKAGAIARGDGKVTIMDIRTAASIHSAVRRSRQHSSRPAAADPVRSSLSRKRAERESLERARPSKKWY